MYLEYVPKEQHVLVHLSLSEGEAFEAAFTVGVRLLQSTDEMFATIRAELTPAVLHLVFCNQFNHRVQQPNERLTPFVRDLRPLRAKVFPNTDPESAEEPVLQQLLEGMWDSELQKVFLRHPLASVDAALHEARIVSVLVVYPHLLR